MKDLYTRCAMDILGSKTLQQLETTFNYFNNGKRLDKLKPEEYKMLLTNYNFKLKLLSHEL